MLNLLVQLGAKNLKIGQIRQIFERFSQSLNLSPLMLSSHYALNLDLSRGRARGAYLTNVVSL